MSLEGRCDSNAGMSYLSPEFPGISQNNAPNTWWLACSGQSESGFTTAAGYPQWTYTYDGRNKADCP
jgi:hypothetical protein